MKKHLFAVVVILSFVTTILALDPIPDCYHTYDEIITELQQLETQYPSIAKVYNIGHSQLDSIPIYVIKISDNVLNEEFEPAVVFVGQVHAEEVLGVETIMSNINEILANNTSYLYRNWINNLEMWFIPTLNPEGHNVVTSNLDVSYRKNKRDNNNNGILDINPLVGYDIDGVDINRNFSFNWCHGDTLMQPGSTEVYDYYRGPAPMSESEVQGFKSFCDAQKPVFSIIWHSARNVNGGLNEKVFYPLNWGGIRPAPDLDLGIQIGTNVAAQIIMLDGTSGYEASAASGRKGGANDWMYLQYGTIPLVIECGVAPNIQPTDSLMNLFVSRNTLGAWWMLNRALRTSNLPSNSMLGGVITDAVTGNPLEAEVIVEQKNSPWFTPRKSDPVYGRYWRPITSGLYTLHYRKKGYADYIIPSQSVFNNWMIVNVQMQPLSAVTLSGTVRSSDGGQLIPAKVTLFDVENETQLTNGEFVFNSFEGIHRIEIDAEGYYPFIEDIVIPEGISNMNINVVLSPASPVFTEDWENGMTNWIKSGPWVLQNELAVSGYALTDSWGGRGFYSQNCNVWVRTLNPIQIPATGSPMLVFDEHLYTEAYFDSVRIEVSADTLSWQTIYGNSGLHDWWHPVYVPINQLAGQNLYFRFRLTDQSNSVDLTDPGWTIDNIRIVTGSATPNSDETVTGIPVTILYQNFPNPFNPETTIKFSLSVDSPVSIDIYNIKGQKVINLASDIFKGGTHTLKWNGTDENGKPVSSGIYFCTMNSNDKVKTQKMILLK